MPDQFVYLFLNVGSVLIPFIASFYPKKPFYKEFRAFFLACLPVATFFIAWDIWFTDISVWGFNQRYLVGLDLFNLPLEEVLFFICIPFACTFTFFAFQHFYPKSNTEALGFRWALFSGIALVIIGFMHYDKAYTLSAFSLCGVFLIWLSIERKWNRFKLFFISYVVCLLPFYAVNGVLTGSLILEQVVWYDDQENLGVRLLTIPIEDHVYGFLLLALNAYLFEKFRKKRLSEHSSTALCA